MRFKIKPLKTPNILSLKKLRITVILFLLIVFTLVLISLFLTDNKMMILFFLVPAAFIIVSNLFWGKFIQSIFKNIPQEVFFEGSDLVINLGFITKRLNLRDIKEVEIFDSSAGLPRYLRYLYQFGPDEQIKIVAIRINYKNPLVDFFKKGAKGRYFIFEDPEGFIAALKTRTSHINFKEEVSVIPSFPIAKEYGLSHRVKKASLVKILVFGILIGAMLGGLTLNKFKTRIYDNLSRIHLIRGNLYYNNRKYSQSVKSYQKALKYAPDDPVVYNQLSMAYMALGSYQEAQKAAKEAIRLDPDFTEAHQNYAVTFRLMGHYKESVEACKRTIELDPDFAKAYCSMGWAYEEMGRYDKAIDCHKQAIAKSPNFMFAHYRLGRAYLGAEKRKLAVKEYNFLKENSPSLADALGNELFTEDSMRK